ncbi:MAG: CaiB/BaiF CoA-transferase family protein, partial [Gammaproteobacteria bacterium]|nr:CaiB/BaiF CoA-transferase family protein [Gammaproteobacteria bacterium]
RNRTSASFAMMNRNKRSIVIDARTEEGRGILLDLIQTADVLVENFRPGVMTRLGLDYETVKSINPQLIFTSINGVGSKGPYANRRVYDAVIQGVSGMAALQSDPDTGRPQMINTLICDKITSLHAAQVISAALYAREKTGVGQRVELTMLDASLFFIWPDAMSNFGLVGDDVEKIPFGDHTRFVRQTQDGYVAVMPVKAAEWEGTFRALNLENLWNDERFNTLEQRLANTELLQQLLDEAYAEFSTDEICARLEAEDVPYSLINSRENVLEDPQIQAMGALVEFEHPVGGAMRQPRPTGQFHGTPAGFHRHSPELGEHTAEVLGEIGRTTEEIAELRDKGVIN